MKAGLKNTETIKKRGVDKAPRKLTQTNRGRKPKPKDEAMKARTVSANNKQVAYLEEKFGGLTAAIRTLLPPHLLL